MVTFDKVKCKLYLVDVTHDIQFEQEQTNLLFNSTVSPLCTSSKLELTFRSNHEVCKTTGMHAPYKNYNTCDQKLVSHEKSKGKKYNASGAIIGDGDRKRGVHAAPSKKTNVLFLEKIAPPSTS